MDHELLILLHQVDLHFRFLKVSQLWSEGLFDFEVLQLPSGSLCQLQGTLLGDLGRTLLGEPPEINGTISGVTKGGGFHGGIQNGWFIPENPMKMDDLDPYFRKPPIQCVVRPMKTAGACKWRQPAWQIYVNELLSA